jgi:resuscitation-promoting factor RpfB
MREETAITKRIVIAGFVTLTIVCALIISLLSRPVATAAGGSLARDEQSTTRQNAARIAGIQEAENRKLAAERKAKADRAARDAERKKVEEAKKAKRVKEQKRLEASKKSSTNKKAPKVTSNKKNSSAPAPARASGSVWDRLAKCESGGRWSYNGSSGFDGGLQFHPSTWRAYKPSGYPAYAWQASRNQQIAVAEKVLGSQGWGAWPACSRKLGLR